jgi:hypothetical protein
MASHHQKQPTARYSRPDQNFPKVSRWDTFREVDAIQEFRRHWGDTLKANLAVAEIAVKIQRHVKKSDYDDLGLPCQYSWFRKLIKIGKHPNINDPEYRDILPDARRTLYQISLLGRNSVTGQDLFLEAFEEGIIHRHTTAKEVERWRKRKMECKSDLLIKLTVTEKKKLGRTEDKPDPEMLDRIISVFGRYADTAGYRVTVNEIISDRQDEARETQKKAKRNQTPAGVKKLRESMQGGDTHAMRRAASGEWDCEIYADSD